MESATTHTATLTRGLRSGALPRSIWTYLLASVQIGFLATLAATLNTWTDEEYTLASTAHGVGYAVSKAIGFELQAPFYFVLLAALRTVDGSVFFARMFSVLCAVAMTSVTIVVAQRFALKRPALFAWIVAVSPFTTYAALEARLYAFALLLATLLIVVFCEGFLRDRRWAQIAFVPLALCATYTQYYEATLLVGLGCALLATRREALRAYVIACVVIGIGLVPVLALVGGQVGSVERFYGGVFAIVRLVARTMVDFLLPHAWDYNGATHRFYRALQVVLLFSIAFARPRLSAERWAAVALAAGCALAFVVIGSIAHIRFDVPRHLVALFVPTLLAGYAVVTAGRGRAGAFAGALALAIFSLSAGVSLISRYHALANPGDWKRVGAYLGAEVRPGDVVVVFDGDSALPLSRYYSGPAPLVGIPHGYSLDHYRASNFIATSESDVAAPLALAFSSAKRVWLVTDNSCQPQMNPIYGCSYLEAVIARDYKVFSDAGFFEARVRRIQPDKSAR